MTTRNKLLVTIGVLWLAAAIGIVAYIAANPVHDVDTTRVPITRPSLPEDATREERLADAVAPRNQYIETESEDMNVGAMLTWLAIITVTAGGVAVVATTWTGRGPRYDPTPREWT